MMKNELMATATIAGASRTIEEMNADFMREDARVHWCGSEAILFCNKTLAIFDAGAPNLVGRITRWLNRSCYRCTQIQNGKINL